VSLLLTFTNFLERDRSSGFVNLPLQIPSHGHGYMTDAVLVGSQLSMGHLDAYVFPRAGKPTITMAMRPE
jgi:hypothetical protein